MNILLFVLLFTTLGLSKAEALITFDEGVSGDLGFSPLQNFGLASGSNEIIGSALQTPDIFDPFVFNFGSSLQLNSIKLVSFSGPFLAFSLYGSSDASTNYIGGMVIDSNQVGTDLLFPSIGSSSLLYGTYSARLFSSKSETSSYRLDFQTGAYDPDGGSNAVPEPATMFLLGTGLVGASLRFRKARPKS